MSDQTTCQHALGAYSLDGDVYLITDNDDFDNADGDYERFDFCPNCGMNLSEYKIPMKTPMKEYSKTEFPTIEHVDDEIADQGIGYQEYFKYDGKQYHASVQHDGTYLKCGIKGVEVIITEIND